MEDDTQRKGLSKMVLSYQDINDKIENAYNDITKARKLLLKEEIDAKDFKEIKQENENNIQVWEAKLMEASKRTSNIEPILDKALTVLSELDQLYRDGNIKKKRAIIGSIYPEKLVFDGFQYRTTRINEAVELIYTLNKAWDK